MLPEVRIAIRTLLKRPMFTISAVLVLALGIGANVAVFLLAKAVLIEPLPFSRQETGSLALAGLVRSFLFGVSATDLVVLVGVSVTLFVVCMLASSLPAIRPARVDPTVALRGE